jgi:hypothetical protein
VIDLFHGVDDMRAMRLERKLIIPLTLHLHLIPDFLGLCGPFYLRGGIESQMMLLKSGFTIINFYLIVKINRWL